MRHGLVLTMRYAKADPRSRCCRCVPGHRDGLDRTPFEAIKAQFELDEAAVIALMRQQLKPGSFRLWRARVQGRRTKHAALRPVDLEGGHRHQARHRTPQR